MPPKRSLKRKSNDSDNDTDDEVLTKPTGTSKRGRKLNTVPIKEDNLKFDLKWCEYDDDTNNDQKHPVLYYLYSENLPGRKKIAGFDIDGTIIVTKSGKKFAIDNKDWCWFDKSVPAKLKQLDNDGYRVVFITNQGGIEKGKTKIEDFKHKFNEMLKQLDIPIYILISTGESHYRKPSNEMWKFLLENCNAGVEVDINECFYVGDAAGRAKNWAPGKPKDFSCSDRMFASNSKIDFHTPDEFFLGCKKVPFEWNSINPVTVLKNFENMKPPNETYYSNVKEMIILMGPPACGKSTFYQRYLAEHNYVHINRDLLQTAAKCLKAAESALNEGKSICIDNTNPSKKARGEYIELAKKLKVRIRCFVFDTDIELCHHLNYVRQNQTRSKVRRIPDVGYNVFKSQYEEPNINEGFYEIKKIKFHPKFDSVDDEMIFKQWTA